MDFVNLLPGVTTRERQPPGASINGLPRGTINITLDGVNIQDNTLRTTDGFFAIVSPRLDAIEEVTVSTAAQGAGRLRPGRGAGEVRDPRRHQQLHRQRLLLPRRDKLNANTWFNNRDGVAKPKLKQNQFGVRFGGPIVIPGLFDGHNKAFFFVNYEELRQPSRGHAHNRDVLNPAAQAGNYSYYRRATRSTCCSSRPPTASSRRSIRSIGKLLADIRSATGTAARSATSTPTCSATPSTCRSRSMRRYPTVAPGLQLHEQAPRSLSPTTTRSSRTFPTR